MEETQPQIEQAPNNTKDNKMLVILLSILIAMMVVIGGALIAVNWNNWFGEKSESSENSSNNNDTPQAVVDNTELEGGTVTVEVDGKSITYSGAYIVDGIDATIGSGEYSSAVDNQAVFVVANGGTLTIDGDVTINKSGSADFDGRGDDYSFYGLNSAIVVVGSDSNVMINGAMIETSTSGANAVVSVDGAFASVSDTVITTTADGSRGLHATFGGNIEANGVEISTQGGSSAALATDRGSGTIKSSEMVLNTAGAGSPLIYSTGSIAISSSTGTATGAQIAVIEGNNSAELVNCEFSANGNGNRNGVDNAGVMIYQSMSGDADEGTGLLYVMESVLSVLDTSSVYNETPFLFVTNTTAEVVMQSSKINFSPEQTLVMAVSTEEWGNPGENGGNVEIELMDTETTNNNMVVDSFSNVNIVE